MSALSDEQKALLRLKSDLSVSVRIRSADLVLLLEEIEALNKAVAECPGCHYR